MTLTPERRTTLPLIDLPTAAHARGKRSAVTCALKCGNACSHPVPNESANDYFPDIADRALSRRSVLGAGAATGLVLTFAGPVAAAAAKPKPGSTGLAFEAISAVTAGTDTFNVPTGYRWAALIRWGDPILKGAPAFDPANQSETAQAMQFGYNCDYLDVIALDGKRKKAVAVVNHEYTNENIMFPPTTDPEQVKANKRTAIAAHGLSVVSLKRAKAGDPWRLDPSRKLNRRITGMTEFLVDGPAAGSDLLKTVDDPTGTRVLGTFNNCAGGTTPWGTVLSGEENFNQYFLVPNAPGTTPPAPSAESSRYGLLSTVVPASNDRAWWDVEPRFNAQTPGYENEPNRFGWVVEIDPMDPDSTPVKHTALGRFKHEAANIRIAPSGHVVAYSGDDERFDYIYKFISRGRYDGSGTTAARRRNMALLSDGDLYVAQFTGDSPAAEIDGTGKLPADGEFDGSGSWIPLVKNGASMVAGMSVAEVLVYTRLAADRVGGATKMDRPEDIECHPQTGAVYIALTNNANRGTGHQPQGRRGQPAHRQPGRSRGRARRGRQRPDLDDVRLEDPARLRPAVQPEHLLRRLRQDEGLADLVPRQRRLRPGGQPVDLHRRPAQLGAAQRRAPQGDPLGARARPGPAVPVGARRRRDLRPRDPRRRGPGLRLRPASRRERHLRRPALVLPRLRRARHAVRWSLGWPAPVGGAGLQGLTPAGAQNRNVVWACGSLANANTLVGATR